MNEDERAAFYYEHRDDPDLWEPMEVHPPFRRGKLGATITVRFTPEELEGIRAASRSRGWTYSQIVRAAVASYVVPHQSVDLNSSANPIFVVRDSGRASRPPLHGATQWNTASETGPLSRRTA